MSPTNGHAEVVLQTRTRGSLWGIVAAKASRYMPEPLERAALRWAMGRLRVQSRIGAGPWHTYPARAWWEGDQLFYAVGDGEGVVVGQRTPNR